MFSRVIPDFDRAKIENLTSLIDLSLNQNPLGTIPPFNNTKIQFLALHDTSLTSATFPSSYTNSLLRTISLSSNKLRSIKVDDFIVFRNSTLSKLHLDDASISTIDPMAFSSLAQLQSLSLKNNQLKSCEFLPNLLLLSSIHLDGNQFTSLPQELSTPKKIKSYSFQRNAISIIDESSPLFKWWKANYTDIKIYLANNSFDCCSSLWFIRLLKSSPQFVPDASLLTCATPLAYAGKSLLKLDPEQMNCSGGDHGKSWWTTGRIIGIVFGTCVTIGMITAGIIVFYFRPRPTRSGYLPIDQTDEDPYSDIDASLSHGPAFLRTDEDAPSRHPYAGSIRNLGQSEAPTYGGISAVDGSQVGGIQSEDTSIPHHIY